MHNSWKKFDVSAVLEDKKCYFYHFYNCIYYFILILFCYCRIRMTGHNWTGFRNPYQCCHYQFANNNGVALALGILSCVYLLKVFLANVNKYFFP